MEIEEGVIRRGRRPRRIIPSEIHCLPSQFIVYIVAKSPLLFTSMYKTNWKENQEVYLKSLQSLSAQS